MTRHAARRFHDTLVEGGGLAERYETKPERPGKTHQDDYGDIDQPGA